MEQDKVVEALTRLTVQMENVEKVISEIKAEIRPAKNPVLPVTGGIAGVLAMVWAAYLQASGQA